MEQPPGIVLNVDDYHKQIIKLINSKNYEELETHLNNGLDPNMTFGYGDTNNGTCLLSFAVRTDDTQIVQLFLDHGADPNIDTFLDTPIFNAIQAGNENIMKLLINHGANVNNVPDITGSILHTLVVRGISDELTKLIISRSDDINKHMQGGLPTALHFAVMLNNLRMVKYLIEAGADMKILDDDNKTALDLARDDGMDYMVKLIESYDVPDKGVCE